MKHRLFFFVLVFLACVLIVYAASRQVGPVFLDLPKTNPSLDIYSSFNITCSYIESGSGTSAFANVYFEFNNSNTDFANITSSSVFNTSNTNPTSNVATNTNASINVTVRDIGNFSVRCRVVDANNVGITNLTRNQSISVVDTKNPLVNSFYPTNATNFESNSSLNVSLSATVSDNFKVDFVKVNITNPNGNIFTLILSNKTSLTYYNNSFVNKTLGRYNITLFVNDTSNNINVSNGFFYINDTVYPQIDFASGTDSNNSNFTRTFIFVNVSVTETNPQNITFILYNSSSLVNKTEYFLGDLSSNLSINFSGLAFEYYYYNVSIVDSANNRNQTVTRGINLSAAIIPDTTPPKVSLISPQNTTYSASIISVNFSLNENGTCFFSLDGITNYSMTANNSKTGYGALANFISDGSNTLRAYCNDTSGNINNTVSVTFSKDSSPPLIDFGIGVENNYVNLTRDFIYINVSVNETNFANITFLLKNDSSIVNKTTYNTSIYSINFTNLAFGNYTYNVSVYDTFGNFNSTSDRAINLSNISVNQNNNGGGSSSGGGGGGGGSLVEIISNQSKAPVEPKTNLVTLPKINSSNDLNLVPIYPYIQELFTQAREDILEMRSQGIPTNTVNNLFKDAYNAFLEQNYNLAESKILSIRETKQKALLAKSGINKIRRNPINFLTGAATTAYVNEDFDYVIKAASISTNGSLMVFISNLIVFLVLFTFISRVIVLRQKANLMLMIDKKKRLRFKAKQIRNKTNIELKRINKKIVVLDKQIRMQARKKLREIDLGRLKIKDKVKTYQKEEKKDIKKIDFSFKKKEHPYVNQIKELNKKRLELSKLIKK